MVSIQAPGRMCSIAAAALTLAHAAHAEVVAVWNFNDSNAIVDREFLNGTPVLQTSGIIHLYGTALGADRNDPPGKAFSKRLRPPQVPGGGLDWWYAPVLLDMTGWRDLSIRVAAKAMWGPSARVQYSLNGGQSWSYYLPQSYYLSSNWSLLSWDLSSISGLNNNPQAAIRFKFLTSDATLVVIDNLVLSANPIPAPGGAAAFAGLLVFAARRRR